MAALADLRVVLSRNEGFRRALAAGDHFDKVAAAHAAAPAAIAGADSTHPQVLAQQWAEFFPSERAAMFKGLRSEIGRRVSTNPNDLSALKRAVGGEGDRQGANIRTIAGDKAADGLIGAVETEKDFANTLHKVDANSESANRLVMSKAIDRRAEAPEIKLDTTWLGAAKGAAQFATRATYRLLVNAGPESLRRELSLALTETGARRTALVQGIMKSGATSEGKVEQISKVLGDPRLARSLVQASTLPLTVDVRGGRSAKR